MGAFTIFEILSYVLFAIYIATKNLWGGLALVALSIPLLYVSYMWVQWLIVDDQKTRSDLKIYMGLNLLFRAVFGGFNLIGGILQFKGFFMKPMEVVRAELINFTIFIYFYFVVRKYNYLNFGKWFTKEMYENLQYFEFFN